ncbi:hypothetical protein DFH09DRAFT_1396310 [Mycena vulgaris]|nr:hypothetical protein DFH09DRAFT_1396310 [Mycena vulgaris]
MFSIQELCDQITGHLVEDLSFHPSPQDDLKSLALSLSVAATPDVVKPLSTIRFPVLRKIRLNFNFGLGIQADDDLHLSREYIGLPSIREVKLIQCFTQDLDALSTLLEASTPELHTVTVHDVWVTSVSPALARPVERHAPIKKLKLVASRPSLADWFMFATCPLDFTHLVEVEVDSRYASAFARVLNCGRVSITRLVIHSGILLLDRTNLSRRQKLLGTECQIYYSFYTTKVHTVQLRINCVALRISCNQLRVGSCALDLSEFRALRYLQLTPLNLEVISSLKPANCVETLVLNVDFLELSTEPTSLIDALVSHSSMPALRQVEVRIWGHSPVVTLDLESVTSYFPQPATRGLLVVMDYRVDSKPLDLVRGIELSKFPALRCLGVNFSKPQAISFKPSAPARIETIAFQLGMLNFQGGRGLDVCSWTDSLVADSLHLPVIQRMEVQVSGPSNDYLDFRLEYIRP